ncbi:MAG: fused MFS/spermidine synthase [Verrucomicrobiae bacterium]|nr:fused MFS/spermidine synthase [Verrucomicrobiae bacterium]MDW7979783.1 fused MFS/spermidine synthase [Verrucomicrobiales bacterium]
MKSSVKNLLCAPAVVLVAVASAVQARTVFEVTTVYHHIRVVDQGDERILFFDDTQQTRVSLRDPTAGHFEYTEYFHMPWLWNDKLTNVLMIGLGGGSVQRAFERFYPEVNIETVEIDAVVLRVATDFFNFKQSQRQRVHIEDGRVFLRRAEAMYDLIIVDAYVASRYGLAIPAHLATKEFFALAAARLGTNGVLAYNVAGTFQGPYRQLIGSIYKTMKAVFPQVYLFPASSTMNVVLIGTKSAEKLSLAELRRRAELFVKTRPHAPSWFLSRVEACRTDAPPNLAACPVLTDNYAPVEGLARMR